VARRGCAQARSPEVALVEVLRACGGLAPGCRCPLAAREGAAAAVPAGGGPCKLALQRRGVSQETVPTHPDTSRAGPRK